MQKRALATRRRVIAAAAAVLEEHGYDGAPLAEILQVAHVTKGGLYHHFASKADLIRALIDEQFQPTLTTPLFANSAATHVIEVTLSAARALTHDVEFRAAFGVVIDRPRAELGDAAHYLSAWRTTLARLLEEAREAGILVSSIDPDADAGLIIGQLIGQFCVGRVAGDYEHVTASLHHFWNGYIARATSPRHRSTIRLHLTALAEVYSQPGALAVAK